MNFFDSKIILSSSSSSDSTDEDSDTSLDQSSDKESEKMQDNCKEITNLDKEKINTTNSLLPSALDAFSEVMGPPKFLSPEATKPIASNPEHLRHQENGEFSCKAQSQSGFEDQSQNKNKDTESSSAANSLNKKNLKRNKSEGAVAAVIEAKAKKYKIEEIMSKDEKERIMEESKSEYLKRGTPAMELTEFLGRAGGGAVLPRSSKVQKDKEKLKRSKGQSSHATWKSEEEMLLKQLYD